MSSSEGMSEERLKQIRELALPSIKGWWEMIDEIDRLRTKTESNVSGIVSFSELHALKAERDAAEKERDALRAEVERLTGELRGASDEIDYQVERFKKRGGEIDALEKERDAREREDLEVMQEIQAGLEQYLLKRPREPQITLAEISSYERTLRMRVAKRLAGREKS